MATKRPRAAKRTSKRSYVSQTEIPKLALADSIRVAQSLYDDFAGRSAAPHQLAVAVDLSPTSSHWDRLCGAALAYGLTDGGSKAERIALTPLGRRIVAPTEEGDDLRARVEAVLRPRVLREFFGKYNRAKFPSDKIALNVLGEMEVPQERLAEVLDIVKRNGEFAGLVHQTKTGPFVALDEVEAAADEDSVPPSEAPPPPPGLPDVPRTTPPASVVQKTGAAADRVFITHGKNKAVVTQLKELLSFGKLTPIVAEEHETTSKPVPDKVLDDMRSCFAGIIHVESEDELLDKAGNVHHKLNENVLIEIGAALALFYRNVILLVHKGVTLPSNLQGLYRCNYEGDQLDYDATMKLLKAFNEFAR